MNPSFDAWNFIPSSTALGSDSEIVAGACAIVNSEHGQAADTAAVTPIPGCSTLPLSSTARLMSVYDAAVWVTHENVQFSRPAARCHVAPPSVDTSTAASTPPPASVAVP